MYIGAEPNCVVWRNVPNINTVFGNNLVGIYMFYKLVKLRLRV